MIEIKDVMKSFENKNVLNHLNVTISSRFARISIPAEAFVLYSGRG